MYKVLSSKLYSYVALQYHAYHYNLTDWNYPKVGKFFVFDTLENAKNFIAFGQIYKCDVLNPLPQNYILSVSCLEFIPEFWRKQFKTYMKLALPPKGTYVCDGLRLNEKVYEYR